MNKNKTLCTKQDFEYSVVFYVIFVTADGISNVYQTIGAKKRNTPRVLFKISRPAVWRCHLIRGSSGSHSGRFVLLRSFPSPFVLPSHGSRRDRALANCSDKSHVTILFPTGCEFVAGRLIPSGRTSLKADVRETCVSLGQFLYSSGIFQYPGMNYERRKNKYLPICVRRVSESNL